MPQVVLVVFVIVGGVGAALAAVVNHRRKRLLAEPLLVAERIENERNREAIHRLEAICERPTGCIVAGLTWNSALAVFATDQSESELLAIDRSGARTFSLRDCSLEPFGGAHRLVAEDDFGRARYVLYGGAATTMRTELNRVAD